MNNPIVIEQEPQAIFERTHVAAPLQVYVSGENVPQVAPIQPPPFTNSSEQGRSLIVTHELTVDEVLERFARWMRLEVADGRGNPSTIKAYLDDTRDHLMWLAELGLKPTQVNDEIVMEYRRLLIEKFKITTAGRKMTSVRRFYAIAYARGMLKQDPAARVKSPGDRTPPENKVEERLISMQHMALMCARAKAKVTASNTVNQRVKAMRDYSILMMINAQGLREIEVTRLNIEDFKMLDPMTSTVTVFGKRDKVRTVHLSPDTFEVLQPWMAAHEMIHVKPDDGDGRSPAGTPLFVSLHWSDNGHGKGGTRISTRGVRAVFDEYLTAVGGKRPGVSGHGGRHGWATWSYFNGATLAGIASEAGHGQFETTMNYVKVVDHIKNNPSLYLGFLGANNLPEYNVTGEKEKQQKAKKGKKSAQSASRKKGTEKEN
ncbi:Tyrosine recombinase XerC [Thermoflexales bacterium]|nr:Tyrosine recombinase XerC [Thermoflexales bacterium]